MQLFKLEQSTLCSYDTYDSCVVVAENILAATVMYPGGKEYDTDGQRDWPLKEKRLTQVIATYLGEASAEFVLPEIICSSFNAG